MLHKRRVGRVEIQKFSTTDEFLELLHWCAYKDISWMPCNYGKYYFDPATVKQDNSVNKRPVSLIAPPFVTEWKKIIYLLTVQIGSPSTCIYQIHVLLKVDFKGYYNVNFCSNITCTPNHLNRPQEVQFCQFMLKFNQKIKSEAYNSHYTCICHIYQKS